MRKAAAASIDRPSGMTSMAAAGTTICSASAPERAAPITRMPGAMPVTSLCDRIDHAGELRAGREGQGILGLVAALDLQSVDEADAGGVDAGRGSRPGPGSGVAISFSPIRSMGAYCSTTTAFILSCSLVGFLSRRFPFRLKRTGALDSCVDAFSSREPVAIRISPGRLSRENARANLSHVRCSTGRPLPHGAAAVAGRKPASSTTSRNCRRLTCCYPYQIR